MRALLLLLLALVACEESAKRAGRAESVASGVTQGPQRVKVKTDLLSLRAAIITYQRLHEGQNPSAISDLEQIERLFYPDEYEYDPETATVKSQTFPDL